MGVGVAGNFEFFRGQMGKMVLCALIHRFPMVAGTLRNAVLLVWFLS